MSEAGIRAAFSRVSSGTDLPHGGLIENRCLDEGTPGWKAGPADMTCLDVGRIDPKDLMELPGSSGEDALFLQSPTGRMTRKAFDDLVADLRENGMRDPVTIHVEQDLRIAIHEGNHRLRAADQAGVPALFEVRYFGNAQRHKRLFWDRRLAKNT